MSGGMDVQDAAMLMWQQSLQAAVHDYQAAGDKLAGVYLRGNVLLAGSIVKRRNMLTVLHLNEIDLNSTAKIVGSAWEMAHSAAGCKSREKGGKDAESHGIVCGEFNMAREYAAAREEAARQ